MYVFDRWSPYSYQNNREKYADDDEKREFTMRECLWFWYLFFFFSQIDQFDRTFNKFSIFFLT